jgi:hypothetical protein
MWFLICRSNGGTGHFRRSAADFPGRPSH